jgi:hypothetical protein
MSDIGPENNPRIPNASEKKIWEDLAMSIVLNSINMPREFKPMNLDRDEMAGFGGGPDDPEAENKMPIKPICF